MYKRVKRDRLGVKSSHRKSMLRNLATSLFLSGKVETTIGRAKALKAYSSSIIMKDRVSVDKQNLIKSLKKTLYSSIAINNALKLIESKDSIKINIVKTRIRKGDNAEMGEVFLGGFDKVVNRK